MPFTADAIATILHAPRENVEAHWPLVTEALGTLKILEPAVEVAAIASIGTESYLFAPEREAGTEAYFRRMYEFDRSLGNLEPGMAPGTAAGASSPSSGAPNTPASASWWARTSWSSRTWPWTRRWPPGSWPTTSC
ncbi:MAG: hypothetical protein IPI84_08400 [Holophagaceae bacterium]|nr:hypothetical protein [Holophagaceae bacterium]